ncbi:ROK family protein [Synechococcus sp. CS-1324]|uniref:ROK family protein n=1 Tax=unclassified Synechococcus TaxID=2626047 RepID=UPI000DB3D877|nr:MULTISPECIES: ROK family protein [unclassified Synechococcus]MCT0212968.1 ROK family protein [Synechococcus sp. CS-1326]MCT0229392.1 ROK family protein [Synechococcus sp. CS-1324]MCT0232212.1 ROK family protein [Synechococcus sp. CS-1327]PZV06116.1 MAG: ROK family protein [Cyanobium sp.]
MPAAPAPPARLNPAEQAELIGVDLGGTAIKLGRFNADGQLLAELSWPTPQPALPGAVTMALAEAITAIDPQRQAVAVGIGLPGPMDAAGRVARVCINLPGWHDVPLAAWLEPRLGRPVTLANDGNCALLGEAWCGAARGHGDVLLLTLGTGVGGGVLLAGQLFSGHNGAAAEPGLICLDPNGPACNSGNRGSLEQYCSIAGLARLSPLDPHELVRRAELGEAEAQAIWNQYGRWLGIGISSLVYVLTPELVLLGGGLSAASPHFLPALWREVEERVEPASREGLRIERCALGNGAGRLGAARLALERLVLRRLG